MFQGLFEAFEINITLFIFIYMFETSQKICVLDCHQIFNFCDQRNLLILKLVILVFIKRLDEFFFVDSPSFIFIYVVKDLRYFVDAEAEIELCDSVDEFVFADIFIIIDIKNLKSFLS